jgi:hypothetical protein
LTGPQSEKSTGIVFWEIGRGDEDDGESDAHKPRSRIRIGRFMLEAGTFHGLAAGFFKNSARPFVYTESFTFTFHGGMLELSVLIVHPKKKCLR